MHVRGRFSTNFIAISRYLLCRKAWQFINSQFGKTHASIPDQCRPGMAMTFACYPRRWTFGTPYPSPRRCLTNASFKISQSLRLSTLAVELESNMHADRSGTGWRAARRPQVWRGSGRIVRGGKAERAGVGARARYT